jgi:CTP synthase (UTP-ammonia lyase)
MSTLTIGLVGDYSPSIPAHNAIPRALALAAAALDLEAVPTWLPTGELASGPAGRLEEFDAIWCVPGSPYASTEGALGAIRFAREQGVPFLGTCGGFQHALIEYARNVLAFAYADHAELGADPELALMAPLSCALVEEGGWVRLAPGSRIAAIYGALDAHEVYHCRYGVNPRYRALLDQPPLRVSALDDAGEVRAVELDGHPFFLATLFQPERAALLGSTPPLVTALLQAASSIRRRHKDALASR